MTIFESLQVAIFGVSIVFVALIFLSSLLKVQSYCFGLLQKKSIEQSVEQTEKISSVEKDTGYSQGELKLLGLDEKTAAMIMAIVSDESKIPLSNLRFKMIKELV